MSQHPRAYKSEGLQHASVSPLLEDPGWIAGFRMRISLLLALAEELHDNDQVPGYPTGLRLLKFRGDLEFLRIHLCQVINDSNARGFVVCAPADEVYTAYQSACGMMDELAERESQGRTELPLKSLKFICSKLAHINISGQEELDSPSPVVELRAKNTLEVDHPGPKAMRAYLCWFSSMNQTDIAREMGTSQSTVSKWIGKVKKWIANGNPIPGLQELQKVPFRTLATDPHTMARNTPYLDEDIELDEEDEGE